MRIIAGQWGGQSVPGKPSPKLRPTSDKVKEAIFDQLSARFVDDWSSVTVLDLFAGTGSLAIEALSRGAARAVFVDHHLETVRNIKKACESFKGENFDPAVQTEVLCKGALEAIRWLSKRGDRFDMIFLDPPYREDWVAATLVGLADHPLLKKNGLIIAEHDKRESLSSSQALWKAEDSRRYGDTAITFFSAKVS